MTADEEDGIDAEVNGEARVAPYSYAKDKVLKDERILKGRERARNSEY